MTSSWIYKHPPPAMTQPQALYLADVLEDAGKPADITDAAAAELRRLHAELERCKQVCAATAEAWREDVQRKPLTDEEIQDCWQQKHRDKVTERRLITRAIERAHGIGGQDESA